MDLELNFKDGKKISYSDIIEGFLRKLKEAENENKKNEERNIDE